LLEYYFGLLASRLGREQEAILALEKAAQLEPNSPIHTYELGKLYEGGRIGRRLGRLLSMSSS
jgi:tetratricopeptide (TPR) repeat protein